MKTKKSFYLALLVVAAFSLAGCSDNEDIQDSTTERGVVKAEFTISFPQKVSETTRMSGDIVQVTGTFRGIKDIELYPFKVTSISEGKTPSTSISSTFTIPSAIILRAGTGVIGKIGPSSTNANEIIAGSLIDKNNSHLYQDVDIPIGTNAFMFYGQAIRSSTTTSTESQLNGELNKVEGGTTLNDISFKLQQICPNSVLGSNATAIADYLTSIANATGWSDSDNVPLQSLYRSFISMEAGSWASVKGAVQQLYTALSQKTDVVSTAVKTAITTPDYVTAPSGGSSTLTFTEGSNGDYPADIHLPDGAAHLSWNDTQKKFEELSTGDNTGLDIADVTTYVYPASLRYYVLSDIVTSEKSMESEYTSAANEKWTDIVDKYGTEKNTVEYNTRSIAIKDQVQYGVGRLELTVKASGATLADNDNKHSIALTTTSGEGTTYNFPLTGVLVGGQKAVDYKFQQIGTAAAYTIYDNQIASDIYISTSKSAPTHTLVLETKEATEAEQADAVVKIALEFQNNSSTTIVGKDGRFIYPGTKFYLVGTLDPYNNNTYTYSGNTAVSSNPTDIIKKAFVQDRVTNANITINSFKNAYNVMPDLTLPSLELGLSVDLSWKQGIVQEITIQ